MKTEDYEKLGELERIIYDHLLAAFNENQYALMLEEGGFGSDGYLDVEVRICGLSLRCAVNEKNYICWFCGEQFKKLIGEVPHLERKIVAQTKRIVKTNEEQWREQRIKQLQKELDNLKKK